VPGSTASQFATSSWPPPRELSLTNGMKIAVDVAPAEGAAQHWEMRAHYDGMESPVTGNPTADMISMAHMIHVG
jgi:hypothetical protein